MFDQLIRNGLALATELTESLVVEVQHAHWDGVTFDNNAQPQLSPSVPVSCLLEITNEFIEVQGRMTQAKSKLSFFAPLAVSVHDEFTLPDGSTGPILKITGLVDPTTGQPYAPEVYLG